MFRSSQRRTRKPVSTKKSRFRTLTIEGLEARQMLSVNPGLAGAVANRPTDIYEAPPAAISFDATSGKLYLTGDNNADSVNVTLDTHNDASPINDEIVVTFTRSGETTTQRFNRIADKDTLAKNVRSIIFQGYGGNDYFANNTDINCEAHAGDGDDTMYGGSGVNTFFGDAGNDYLVLGSNNDVAHGGVGNDTIYGNNGDDLLYGDDGDDVIQGGAGNDVIYGGNGNDQLFGGDGYNYIYGEAGNDIITGGEYGNSLDGGDGTDDLHGGAGNDKLYGDFSAYHGDSGHGGKNGSSSQYLGELDSIYGDAGDDLIYAGLYDFVDGGAGKNTINVSHTSKGSK